MSDFFMKSGAELSKDEVYRYTLWRIWDNALPIILYIMLNPSKADASRNDQTITLCMGRAKLLGFGGIWVANLFAYRATKPLEMMSARNPVGPDNDRYIRECLARANKSGGMVVAAYGNDGIFLNRNKEVLNIVRKEYKMPVHHLGLTQAGHPRHPLRLPYDSKPQVFK